MYSCDLLAMAAALNLWSASLVSEPVIHRPLPMTRSEIAARSAAVDRVIAFLDPSYGADFNIPISYPLIGDLKIFASELVKNHFASPPCRRPASPPQVAAAEGPIKVVAAISSAEGGAAAKGEETVAPSVEEELTAVVEVIEEEASKKDLGDELTAVVEVVKEGEVEEVVIEDDEKHSPKAWVELALTGSFVYLQCSPGIIYDPFLTDGVLRNEVALFLSLLPTAPHCTPGVRENSQENLHSWTDLGMGRTEMGEATRPPPEPPP